MKFLKCLLVVQFLLTATATTSFAHPPTDENKLDKIDCHYTSGAGGHKHYHKNNDFQIEYPCTEVPSAFPYNPLIIGLSFFIAAVAGALVLGLAL